MKRELSRVFSALSALAIVWLGLWIAYLGLSYYLHESDYPYRIYPLWKSAIIIGLIAACVLVPLYAGFRLVRSAATRGRE